ncbi:MAG: LD-carboxypeptidase [Erysipelotrichaceae bacterium]|nr:LD-carboxypeptidase [Erysipelotrichaceae bacterium]
MRFPKFLKDGDVVALLATSCGSNKNPYRIKTQKGIINFQKMGYKIKKGHRIFRNENAVSAPGINRAKDFMSMYKNKNVDFIWSTGGGELMMNMLPFIDFEKIKKLPEKYFMGFSDNTNLTFTLTTICDIATIYASSISSFAYEKIDEETDNMYRLMRGEKLSFDSYLFFDGEKSRVFNQNKEPLKPYVYLDDNHWKSFSSLDINITGRIIGGCLDILICLCGTKYDNVKNFLEKYKDDGFIWYLDVCDLNSCGLYRALFQLKEANWFKYVKGFLISRPASSYKPMDYPFSLAIKEALEELNVPILYDVDISHIGPSIPVINGAMSIVTFKEQKGSIEYILK